MSADFFVMVLIGCSQSATQCEPITTLPVAYTTLASCQAARPEILSVTGNLGLANVRAECQAQGSAAAAKKADRMESIS